jgi:hypothetical protein
MEISALHALHLDLDHATPLLIVFIIMLIRGVDLSARFYECTTWNLFEKGTLLVANLIFSPTVLIILIRAWFSNFRGSVPTRLEKNLEDF